MTGRNPPVKDLSTLDKSMSVENPVICCLEVEKRTYNFFTYHAEIEVMLYHDHAYITFFSEELNFAQD